MVASPLRPVTPLAGRKPAGLDELLGGSNVSRDAQEQQESHDGNPDSTIPADSTDSEVRKDADAPAERQPSRPKRSSIPSWDEIVFGARGD